MIRRRIIAVLAATTVVVIAQTAQASLTLADFSAGGTLTIDDKTFTGYAYTTSGLTSFDPTKIFVDVSQSGGIDYLTWSGNISLASAINATADLKLNYTVLSTGNLIDSIDQSYVGSAQNGLLSVDEYVSVGSFLATPNVGYSHLQIGDFSDPPPETFDLLQIVPPQTKLYVTKDIGFSVTPPSQGNGYVTISGVAQSFHQVPEPTTMIAGALLLLPFGASALRILRKKQTA